MFPHDPELTRGIFAQEYADEEFGLSMLVNLRGAFGRVNSRAES